MKVAKIVGIILVLALGLAMSLTPYLIGAHFILKYW